MTDVFLKSALKYKDEAKELFSQKKYKEAIFVNEKACDLVRRKRDNAPNLFDFETKEDEELW